MVNFEFHLSKKKKGGVSTLLVGMVAIYAIINIFAMFMFREAILIGAKSMKTSCDLSNLASYKYIDRIELGRSQQIIFDENDVNKVLSTFKEYLMKNMQLDNNLSPISKTSILVKPLTIKKMILYSFENGVVSVYTYTDINPNFIKSNPKGSIKTPSGQEVEKTAIYTEVGYTIELMYGYEYEGVITSYTDIVK